MKVLVIDDHPLMHDALRLVLSTVSPDAEIVGAQDLQTALDMAQRMARIDLVLLDLGLPGCEGVEALVRFRAACPQFPVVVISGSSDRASVLSALDLGAMGFIPKTAPREALLAALQRIAAGGIYVPPETIGEGAPRKAEVELTVRQRDVLQLLLKGLPNKLIARQLEISDNTVKLHVRAVFAALGVHSRTQAVIASSRLGLRIDAPR
jgi:DNA-binding NarL/FixJ family response regulator